MAGQRNPDGGALFIPVVKRIGDRTLLVGVYVFHMGGVPVQSTVIDPDFTAIVQG